MDEPFEHQCITPDCEVTLLRDDEPWCHLHAPESGSLLPGYSAKKADEQHAELEKRANVEHRNIFDE